MRGEGNTVACDRCRGHELEPAGLRHLAAGSRASPGAAALAFARPRRGEPHLDRSPARFERVDQLRLGRYDSVCAWPTRGELVAPRRAIDAVLAAPYLVLVLGRTPLPRRGPPGHAPASAWTTGTAATPSTC